MRILDYRVWKEEKYGGVENGIIRKNNPDKIPLS